MSAPEKENNIVIVGMGFCGMMTAIHLLQQARNGIHLHLVNAGYPLGKGPAYSTSFTNHLLNVPAGKMSCFPSQPDHFLDWIHTQLPFADVDKEILAKMFVPRKKYGEYLTWVWENAMSKKNKAVSVTLHETYATDINPKGEKFTVSLEKGAPIEAACVVLATGNDIPGNPKILNEAFFNSPNYFQSPWNRHAAEKVSDGKNVLIIGNGLTMVDTVQELIENGCTGTIYSLSPNGFTILPHRNSDIKYTKLIKELKEPYQINDLYSLFRKHIKFLREFGLSAGPVVDSVRNISQDIWMKLPMAEKKRFLTHLRHLWGLARHRLPAHIYDLIKELKINGRLIVIKGKLIDITESGHGITVRYLNKKKNAEESIIVSRVINCTGPLPDITKSKNVLVKALAAKGMIKPDALKLGIATNLQGAVIDSENKVSEGIFTLGGTLKGLLWESTAVPELRTQAEDLATLLLKKFDPEIHANS